MSKHLIFGALGAFVGHFFGSDFDILGSIVFTLIVLVAAWIAEKFAETRKNM